MQILKSIIAVLVGCIPSQWITEVPVGQQLNDLGFVDRTKPTPAKKALRSFGTSAIPDLARAMMNQKTLLTELSLKLWFHSSFLQSHFQHPVYPLEVRREAISLLTEIAFKNPEVVGDEQIVRSLSQLTSDKDSDLRIGAISVLGALAVKQENPSAISALIVALDSPEQSVRSWAAWKLSDGGLAQKQALPALNRRLSDPSDAVRINAALAIFRIGNQTNQAVSVLVAALGSRVPLHRGNAAFHLSLLGPAAKDAVSALEAQTKDTDEYARTWAQTALLKIEPHDQTTKVTEMAI